MSLGSSPPAPAAVPVRTVTAIPAPTGVCLDGVGLLSILIGGFAASFTFGSANVVLPMMTRDLGGPPAASTLILAGFSLAFSVALILGGRLGDRFGRRRLFGLGLAGFAVAAVAVGCAPTLPTVLLARVAQGLGAAMMVPQILATIQIGSTGRRRAWALSLYTAANAGGTTVGQVLGGVVASADLFGAGWRPVFWLTGLVAAAGLPLLRSMPPTRAPAAIRQDPVGTLLFGVAVSALLVAATMGRAAGWPWWVLLLVLVTVASLSAFWQWEKRLDSARALVPYAVVRHLPMVAGMIMVSLFFAGYGGFVYLFSLTVEDGLGFTAKQAGLVLAPFALAFLGGALLTPRLLRRVARTRLLRIGAAGQAVMLLGVGAVMLLGWPHPPQAALQPLMVALGAFQALMFTPLLGALVAAVPHHVAGLSGGILSTLQQLWLALGVALLGVVYAEAHHLSVGTAFGACVVIQAGLAVAFFLLAPRTQGPERAAAS